MIELTVTQAVYAAYAADSLAQALETMTSHKRSADFLKQNRASARKWALEAISTSPDDPDFLDRVQWGKNQLRTGGLGEFYNSPVRRAKAQILLAVRELKKDSRRMMAIAYALGGDKIEIGVAALTAPTPQSMAGKAIEILQSNGWRKRNGASNIDARFSFDSSTI